MTWPFRGMLGRFLWMNVFGLPPRYKRELNGDARALLRVSLLIRVVVVLLQMQALFVPHYLVAMNNLFIVEMILFLVLGMLDISLLGHLQKGLIARYLCGEPPSAPNPESNHESGPAV